MDSELNLRLLGMMLQSSYLMQTREKYRGQGRLLVLLNRYGALTQRELIELTGRRSATLSRLPLRASFISPPSAPPGQNGCHFSER